jgi:hypothetical protein
MAALSCRERPRVFTKVEVIKGNKTIRICITNRMLMDISGYYYGRSWTYSGNQSLFFLSLAIRASSVLVRLRFRLYSIFRAGLRDTYNFSHPPKKNACFLNFASWVRTITNYFPPLSHFVKVT